MDVEKKWGLQGCDTYWLKRVTTPIQDIDLLPDDPDYDDDNCLDDLLKGPERCDWRKWLWSS